MGLINKYRGKLNTKHSPQKKSENRRDEKTIHMLYVYVKQFEVIFWNRHIFMVE